MEEMMMKTKTPITDALKDTLIRERSATKRAMAYLTHARKLEADSAELIAALRLLLSRSKSAEQLAWECGCETEDGVYTLLEDSRGDAYRELSGAREEAKRVLAEVTAGDDPERRRCGIR